MNWYEFDQNNSGGSFTVNERVCHRVWIEAEDAKQAIAKAESLGIYFDGVAKGVDCPCCGDRWALPGDPIALTLTLPSIETRAQYLANKYGWTSPDTRLYYADGLVREIFTGREAW